MISISPWVPLRCLQPLQPPGALCGAAGRPLGRRSARLCGAATGGAKYNGFPQREPTGGHRGEWKKWGIYTILWIFMDIYGVELQVL